MTEDQFNAAYRLMRRIQATSEAATVVHQYATSHANRTITSESQEDRERWGHLFKGFCQLTDDNKKEVVRCLYAKLDQANKDARKELELL